jgi:hypothetical protein
MGVQGGGLAAAGTLIEGLLPGSFTLAGGGEAGGAGTSCLSQK